MRPCPRECVGSGCGGRAERVRTIQPPSCESRQGDQGGHGRHCSCTKQGRTLWGAGTACAKPPRETPSLLVVATFGGWWLRGSAPMATTPTMVPPGHHDFSPAHDRGFFAGVSAAPSRSLPTSSQGTVKVSFGAGPQRLPNFLPVTQHAPDHQTPTSSCCSPPHPFSSSKCQTHACPRPLARDVLSLWNVCPPDFQMTDTCHSGVAPVSPPQWGPSWPPNLNNSAVTPTHHLFCFLCSEYYHPVYFLTV